MVHRWCSGDGQDRMKIGVAMEKEASRGGQVLAELRMTTMMMMMMMMMAGMMMMVVMMMMMMMMMLTMRMKSMMMKIELSVVTMMKVDDFAFFCGLGKMKSI